MAQEHPPAAAPPLSVLTLQWRTALRAARGALAAAELPAEERRTRSRRLAAEVTATQTVLQAFAGPHREHVAFVPLALSPMEARRVLGLPPDIEACVFNLDGVLIGSAALHIAAWTETFDEFILNRIERTRGRWTPFSPRLDYPTHIHARPRLDGVRGFLESRGIRLPEGDASDPPGAETVNGLANRKNLALQRRLDQQGAQAFEGSQSYLELAREAGIRCAVVSASAHTDTILARSGLAPLVDERVDGETIRREHLRVKPAPDTLLAACEKLGVAPARAATFETTRVGIAAARRAGFELVVGVDGAIGADREESLRAEGADLVVNGVGEILEMRLAA